MNIFKRKILTSGSFLVGAMIFSNVLNFVFSAYIGRSLTFAQFGLVTLINTFLYIFSMYLSALGATTNQRVAYLTARVGKEAGIAFHNRMQKRMVRVVIALSIIWILSATFIQSFFNVSSVAPILFFLPVLLLGSFGTISGSFIHARFLFIYTGLFNILEASSKLLLAYLFIRFNLPSYVYLAIPLSIALSSIAVLTTAFHLIRNEHVPHSHTYSFPKRFFLASFLTSLSTSAFLTFDILLTKHYFSETTAGIYAFLALVGKMIFFFGSLFNTFMIPFVSRDEGARRDPNKNFYIILSVTTGLTLSAFLGLTIIGPHVLPLVFGSKTLQIMPYLTFYALAICLYTIANTINIYHLARKHYLFSLVSLFMTLIMVIGITQVHKNLFDVVNVILITSIINLVVISSLHLLQRNGGFILANLIDLIGLLFPIDNPKLKKGKLRILIFNWRDTKHVFAGGAELYLHELGRRWVKLGHAVTMFCGNDGHHPRYEMVNGIRIIRRGGFYMVYLWAFLYYAFRLRGKYDVIIDSENGIPFFTPLYAKRERIYLLMHHVHQEVFRKSLKWPFSKIATFLEIKLMPFIYKHIQFITVSPSTKQEILESKLTTHEPHIVYNGVDLKTYKPGKRSKAPFIMYLGRLKYYKTINDFIKVAKQISKKYRQAQFVIAGEGEEGTKLIQYAKRIKSPVLFLGKVSEAKKIELYQKAWVVINPSSMEGWGLTVTEANACGTPVVAANVPGLRDSVKDGINGFLVEHGDIPAYVAKVSTLISSASLRLKMAKSARQFAKNYSWEKSTKNSLGVIKNKYKLGKMQFKLRLSKKYI